MNWIAYNITPIDFGWEMLSSLEDVASRLAHSEAGEALADHGLAAGSGIETYAKFLSNFEHAKQLAKAEGWEGDYRTTPMVFWLPDDTGFSYGFVWKQDNNGNTFVVSPRPLKWLDALR